MSNEPGRDESFRKEIEARVGRTLCQRYTVERLLAIGSTAAVYGGTHRNGNRVAIKVLHAELAASKEVREQFLRDAYVANKIEHLGAVRILDDDTAEDGTVFVVMDLLEGQTLESLTMRAGGTLPAAELVPLIGQLLDVLIAAHAKGIVHRAIEPATLFVAGDRTLKVLAYGAAQLADGTLLASRAGREIETSGYVAPEQARGETMNVDAQTDLWATGAVMFRALAGRIVHPAETPEMVRIHAATQPAAPLRSVAPSTDAGLAEIVDRALASKKDDRWRTAQAMATALRSGGIVRSQPPPPMMASPSNAPSPMPAPSIQHAPMVPVNAAPVPYGAPPGYVMPQSTDNGWIKWVAGAAALIMLVVFGGGVALFFAFRGSSHQGKSDGGSASKDDETWSDADSPVPVTSRDPLWGNRDAPVTIVMFSDFQCPFCARVEPTLEQVKTTYGPDKVRIVWKNQPLPFHEKAKPAAEAAQVLFTLKGSPAFFAFHDMAFKNQKDLSPENFRVWAVAAGVDAQAFDKAVATHSAALKIEEDQALAKKVGANGTPSFRINGVELSGAQPFEKFRQVIDEELAKAVAKLATGTPNDQVYVLMSAQNFAAKPVKKDDEPVEDTKTVFRVDVGTSPVRGNVNAQVTIVEFGDFQCPYCKRAEAALEKVRDTYGNKVRIVWKHQPLPFHPRAEPAAELALEARAQKGDATFFRAHDQLFEAQPKLEDEDLFRIGAALGLDAAKVKAAIREKKHDREINADMQLADDVQASGTPHFFINGRRLVGAQPFEKFQKIIDEELRKFDDQHGLVPAKDYYASLMRDAKGPAELEKKHAPPVPPGAPFRGGKDAKVVIQEWADFQCPFCQRAEPTVAEILKLYGDRVKFVWRDKPLPMHPDAPLAAELAREALAQRGQDGFWKMHDKLFANLQHLKRDDLDGYATELGLDMKLVSRALDGHTHQAAIDTDDRVGTDTGITGTPAFLINSYYVSGAQPVAKFKKVIDRALSEAR
jgi:protein-disulfide isomerase/serine/threonine protein kinase